MSLRFDGRVAIVTGAGGRPGLGRAYAHLLAERGAKVVVNDLGVGPDGRSLRLAPADAVAAEITAAGGEAIADANSVADEAGAQAVVGTALDAWGRVDVLVNNAGVINLALFDEVSSADVQRMLAVHVLGNVWMCRAVWPHLRRAGYGRVVSVGSGAMLGGRYLSIYSAAKGAIFSLSRSLALEGREHGINVNCVLPGAFTAAIDHLQEDSETKRRTAALKPELVAPLVAFLAHEECQLSGRCFGAAGGRVWELVVAETRGYSNEGLTVEDVRDNLAAASDRTDPVENTIDVNQGRRTFVPRAYEPA